MQNKSCVSCLMPLSKNPGKWESEKYCSYCYKNGELCYKENDLKEFQKVCYTSMVEHGTNPLLAKFYTWMVRFAPR